MILDDDEEAAKLTGVNRSTGEVVPFSYDPPDQLICVAIAMLAIIVGLWFIFH